MTRFDTNRTVLKLYLSRQWYVRDITVINHVYYAGSAGADASIPGCRKMCHCSHLPPCDVGVRGYHPRAATLRCGSSRVLPRERFLNYSIQWVSCIALLETNILLELDFCDKLYCDHILMQDLLVVNASPPLDPPLLPLVESLNRLHICSTNYAITWLVLSASRDTIYYWIFPLMLMIMSRFFLKSLWKMSIIITLCHPNDKEKSIILTTALTLNVQPWKDLTRFSKPLNYNTEKYQFVPF